MARRNEKYTQETKEQTAAYILETVKVLGIDVNTVCRWVRDYRKAQSMPSYGEEQGIKRHSVQESELRAKNKLGVI